jgi:AraC-like DNA-binding protein
LIFQHHTPRWPLGEFVDVMWLYESPPAAHAKERVLPSASAQLIISLWQEQVLNYDRHTYQETGSIRGALITGARSEYVIIDTVCIRSVIGVSFKPGGAYAFLPAPGQELHNSTVSLEDLWGADGRDLRNRLLEAPTPPAKFRILEQTLVAHLSERRTGHSAVRFALTEFDQIPHNRTIADVTSQIGLSATRFIHLFHEQVGLTPKLYCRIQRFQQALRQICAGDRVEWTDVALDCGYHDQAHFIHDFRNFSGINPTTYATSKREHQNHVPLPDPA